MQHKRLLQYVAFVFAGISVFIGLVDSARASTLFFHPQNEIVIEEGQSAVIEARLDTEGKSVNALDLTIGFPQHLVEVADVSSGDSIVGLWVNEPRVDNQSGTIHIIGGIPNGGSYAAGLIVRFTVVAKAVGEGELLWSEGAQVLLNDGAGTPDKTGMLTTPLRIAPAVSDVPMVNSGTHPDQTQWYRARTVFLAWPLASGIVYSYSLDHDPYGVPDEVADEPKGDLRFDGTIKYENLDEGVYYFHLRERRFPDTKAVWSRTRTFRIQIDATPPGRLQADIGSDSTVYDGRWFATFSGADALSGIARYDAQEAAGGLVKGVRSPYELRIQEADSPVTIRVVDKAGNEREVTLAVPTRKEPASALKPIFAAVIVIFASVGAGWLIRRKRRGV